MQSDLDQLIAAIQIEQKNLKKQIKEYVADSDFLLAHYHSEALKEITNRLMYLNQFKDPFYNEKMHLETVKLRVEKIKKSAYILKDANMRERSQEKFRATWSERIANELEKIKDKEKQINRFFTDGQEIDDALFDLYNDNNKTFKLTFEHREELTLMFSIKNDHLMVELGLQNGLDYEPDFAKGCQTYNYFKSAGLTYTPENDNLFYRHNMVGFKDAWPIKMFLSHLLFDVINIFDIKIPAKLIH